MRLRLTPIGSGVPHLSGKVVAVLKVSRRRRTMAVGNPFSRRSFLTVGAVGFGLSLGDFFRLKARADLKTYDALDAKADSVIHIFMPGGLAHQESFDPKPFAPIEYRGELATIQTK